MNACAFILIYTREDLLDGSRGIRKNPVSACIYDEAIYAYTYSGMSVIQLNSQMPPEYITLDFDEEPWVESDWIRPDSPRLYPSDNVPAVVKRQYDLLLQLPPATDDLIPHDFVPIRTLLDPNSKFPSPRPDVLSALVAFTCATPDPNPNATVKALKSCSTIPPMLELQKLIRNPGQAWFNGDTSLNDTHYADYPIHFLALTL
jgi:hypothetical protein